MVLKRHFHNITLFSEIETNNLERMDDMFFLPTKYKGILR